MAERNDPLVVQRTGAANGLEVVRQAPPTGSRSVAITYVGPAGWAYDPQGRAGTSVQVAQLVTSAAGRRDRVALAREFDRLGATVSSHSAPESAEVTVWGPTDTWRALLDLLADVVLKPRFDRADVQRVRRQLRERQLRERTQPANRAEFELLRTVFPAGHPYQSSGIGSAASLRRTSRADLVRFHRDHFTAGGAHVVGTVPVALDHFAKEVGRRFGDFVRVTGPTPPEIPTLVRQHPARRNVPLPGRSQVEIRLGGTSVSRSAPEYPGVFLADQILGGRGMLSRLFQRVREQHGLVYHASSEVEAMRWGGYWLVQAGTGPERAEKVLPLLRGEVERLSSAPVPNEELDRIRESVIGEQPLELETSSGAHELAVDVAYHHLPDDFYRTWPETLRSLRASDVRAAAEIGIDPARAVTVEAGPPR